VSGEDGLWVERKDWDKVAAQQLKLWDVTHYLMHHVETVLRKNAVEFLGHQEVVNLLDGEPAGPARDIRASSRMLTALTTVCRALVSEEVPIRPFHDVCATFRNMYANGVNLQEIVERIRLLPAFRERLPGNDGRRTLMNLGTGFEAEIRRSLYKCDGRSILAMTPERCQAALAAVRNQVSGRPHALVVDDAALRPYVRKLVELEFADLPVLSRAEITGLREFLPAGTIDLEPDPAAGDVDFKSPVHTSAMAADDLGPAGHTTAGLAQTSIEAFVDEDFGHQPSADDDKPMGDLLAIMRDGFFNELGIVLPPARLESDESLKAGQFRVRLNGIDRPPVAGLAHDEFLVDDSVDRLTLLDIAGHAAINPGNGNECAIVHDTQGQADACRRAGLTT